MPIIAAWIGKLFVSFVAFLAAFMGRQVAVRVAAVSAIVAVTAGFVSVVNGLISSISVALPSELFIAASWVWPSNGTACLGVILSAHAARWVYDWHTKVIQMRLF